MMRPLITAVLILSLNPLSASAQTPVPVGQEFEVNSYSHFSRSSSAIGPDSEGGFVVVWQSEIALGYGIRRTVIDGRRFSSSGEALADEFRISTNTAASQSWPKVSSNGGDGFVVVWQSYGYYPYSGTNIRGQSFGSDGSTMGSQFRVNDFTTGNQYSPKLSSDGSGGFIVVWKNDDGAGADPWWSIQGQRFTSTGGHVGEEFQVNSYTSFAQSHPVVGLNPREGFVVAWISKGSWGDDWRSISIQGQRYGTDGSKAGEQFQVNSYTTWEQYEPSISPIGDSGFVVAWRSDGSWGSDTDYRSIQGQRFAADGSPVGRQFQVNSYTTGNQYRPVVNPDGAGGFIVLWNNERQYYPPVNEATRVQGQRFSSSGFALGSQFQVSEQASSWEYQPALGLDGGGGFVVTWQSYTGLFGQRFLADDPGQGSFLCVEDARTFCLQNNRFEVTVDWRDFLDRTGHGKVVPGNSEDSGLFWFFNEDNWEMLVKVLDGCPLNDRFWVFSAATTDVEYTLTVRDSFTGYTTSYHNELGTASPAITDTNAFGSCSVETP